MTDLPPAIQHTRCWQAVTAVHMALDKYTPGAGRGLDTHVTKIRRWLDLCEADIRRKKASAGAMREMQTWCAAMDLSGLTGDDLFNRWGSALIAASIMLDDCRNTCPEWFKGKHWHFLSQTFGTLARHAQLTEPNLEFTGFELYMETAAGATYGKATDQIRHSRHAGNKPQRGGYYFARSRNKSH